MTDNLIARPGDEDLDCHLTGLRLSTVTESPFGDYTAEAVLGWDTSRAAGYWVSDGEGVILSPGEVREFTIGFGYHVHPGYEMHAAAQMATLRRWRDDRVYVEMTCAPGKWTLLASGDDRVVIPRKAPVTAGSGQ